MLDSTTKCRRARLWIVVPTLAALILAAAPAHRANAQGAPGSVPLGPSSTPPQAAPPGPPPILATNDPRNPLHLTAKQQEQRNAIVMQFGPQIQAIIRNPKLTPQQKKAELAGIVATANAKIQKILTPAQRAANDKLRKQAIARQAQQQQQVAGRKAEIQQIGKKFESSLTAAQKSKLNALDAAARQQLNQLQADKTLNMQQKQQKYTALGKSYATQANNIYTPAQRAMIEKIRAIETSPLGGPAGH